ncbi:MAG: glycosyltransferase family 4 protein [Candidatus Rokuibacteriota bacterium]
MPARVAINASVIGANPTGLGIYTIKLVQALDRIRTDLVVLTSRPDALQPLRAPTIRIPRVVRPERGMSGHLARLLLTQTLYPVLARFKKLRAMVHTVPEALLWSSVPQLTVVHDVLPLAFPTEYPRQQYYFRHFVPRVLAASRVVVADSESTRSELIERYGFSVARVHVVYPGFDHGAFYPNGVCSAAGEGVPYVLYVGNLLPHKNVLGLIDAFAVLRRRAACRLIVRGEGRPEYLRDLRTRIEALGVEDAVSVVGYVDEPALRRLYCGAACVVVPSLREGFGLPVLESMACGTPVITSACPALVEAAGDAAVRVDAHDLTGLADAMYRLLTDAGLRRELRERGLRQARHFSWDRTAETLSALLDGAIREPGRGDVLRR